MTEAPEPKNNNHNKVAYGPFGNDDVQKALYEGLCSQMATAFPAGTSIPEGALNHYFVGETTPKQLGEAICSANKELGPEETRRILYNALRAWIDESRQEIRKRRMGDYYDPNILKNP